MKRLRLFVLSAATAALGAVGFAQNHTYTLSNFDIVVRSSSGTDFVSALSAQFGVFNVGFLPNTANIDAWGVNFTAAPGSRGYVDTLSPEWDLAFDLTSNAAPFTVGAQLSLWVFNSKATGASSEWLLLTDPSWTVKLYEPLGFPVSFNITNLTTATVGSFNFGAGTGSSVSAVVIPEPSTYALVFGALTLGIVGVRRWRKAA